MYDICVFSPPQSLNRIMQIDQTMRDTCNVTYCPYTSATHLKYLYEKSLAHYDAYLFSGSYPYGIINDYFGNIEKPNAYFSITNLDYYRLFANLYAHNPEIRMERVYLDQPEIFVDFDDIFGDCPRPLLGNANVEWSRVEKREWYLPVQDYYLSIWKTKSIDLLITRFSGMEKFLRIHKIHHAFLLPSPTSMLEIWQGLIMQLNVQNYMDSAACVGVLASPEKLSSKQLLYLRKVLENCNTFFGNCFLIYNSHDHIEITTNISMLKELTNNLTSDMIHAYLSQNIPFPISIGWGYAASIIESHRNAHRALTQALLCPSSASFVMTEIGSIIGPLNQRTRSASINSTPLSVLLSQKTGIAVDYISIIIDILSKSQNKILTASQLSEYLCLTPRSCNRILSKLVHYKLATVEDIKSGHCGRPMKYYHINIDTTLDASKIPVM